MLSVKRLRTIAATPCEGIRAVRGTLTITALWFCLGFHGLALSAEHRSPMDAIQRGHDGPWPRTCTIYRGATPKLDGRISAGEWNDATMLACCNGWNPQFSSVTDPNDLSARVYIKHDGRDLYVAYDVTDNLIYAVDIPQWVPASFAAQYPKIDEFSTEGFPWYGDGVELLVNASYTWNLALQEEYNKANGSSWQMVCSTRKSRLGGLGKAGLMEGEQRRVTGADGKSVPNPNWDNYTKWIKSGAMNAEVRLKDKKTEGSGYVIEWKIAAKPCLEVAPEKFWNPDLGAVKMGLNISIGDFDTEKDGVGNWGNFRHENWWAGEKDKRTWLRQWGTMMVEPGFRPRTN
jgi:solute:Na+ symporter, SSS family